MDEKTLSERVLAKIKEKKIERKAKWTFLLRNYVVWGAGIISLLVGGLALSVVIYMMRHNGWGEYSYVSDSFLQFIFLTLPYFWLVFLGLFVFIADYYIKHTNKGYRYRLPVVVVGSIFVSFLLGGLFYNLGMGQAIDDVLGRQAPFYRQFINPNMKRWNNPEKGLLSGKIISVNSESEFFLRDIDNTEWIVFYEETLVHPIFGVKEDMQINILGKMIGQDSFKADHIKPMGPGRGSADRNMQEMRRAFEENPDVLRERMKRIPFLLEENPEMKGMFEDHMRRNKNEIDQLLKEMPELREDFDSFDLE
ncbi:MAG: hypothetical protein PF572_02145 [Patescibacteria group bacterium]|jgi:hypothetical protein|nr:hypothetical protein [Patescibacteria group bacterium]